MKTQRKTESTDWSSTSLDYILRNARSASLQIAGTKKSPVLASDPNVSDDKIVGFIKSAGATGVQINSVTVRIIDEQ